MRDATFDAIIRVGPAAGGRTDRLSPPVLAAGVMHDLAAAGVDARYCKIDSEFGHSAGGPEHAKWSPALREFLAPLTARLD